MIAMIGIKKNTPLNIREGFAIKESTRIIAVKKLKEKFKEIVVLGTCNRTEIYFNHSLDKNKALEIIFEAFELEAYLHDYIFYEEGNKVYKHILEVSCGYHSRILGEDQILGQIKAAYSKAIEENICSFQLGKLFQEAITCGKKFRHEAKLYEIPVSSVSIAVNKIVKDDCNSVMVIGYGEIGKLSIKYLLSHGVENIYLVLRDKSKAEDLKGTTVKILDFNEKNDYIHKAQAIIACTSAPRAVILKKDVEEIKRKLIIFDMAVPRDVEKDVADLRNIKVLNIDEISKMEDENRNFRKERMNAHKYIINEYISEYIQWVKLRELAPLIKELKDKEEEISNKRIKTYHNKKNTKDNSELVETLIKSTSKAYINRAIEVLKEEKLKGDGEECLRIIKKIFL